MLEHAKYSSNVIIHSLPKSPWKAPENCITADYNNLSNILKHCDLILPMNAKLIRLNSSDHTVQDKFKPLKNILSSKEDAISLVRVFVAVINWDSATFNICIVHDKTKIERNMLYTAHQEHSQRINAGGTNVRIGYHNGIPKVLCVHQKNGPEESVTS